MDDDIDDDEPFVNRYISGDRRGRSESLPITRPTSASATSPSPAPYRNNSVLNPRNPAKYANGRWVYANKWAFTSYDPVWSKSGLPYTTDTLPPALEYVCGKPEYNQTRTESGEQRQHFQGFAITVDKCNAEQLREKLGISQAHASPHGNVEVRIGIGYTQKEESAVPDEDGNSMWREAGKIRNEMLRPAERHDSLKQLITSGASLEDIVEHDFKTALHSFGNIRQIRSIFRNKQVPERDIEVFFIQGEPGLGKSRFVWDIEGDKLYKKENQKGMAENWDGYDDHEAVLFDDIDEELYGIHRMLNLLDRYPLRLNVKYDTVPAKFTRVYITSNRPIEDFFPSVDRTARTNFMGAFLRRIPQQNRVIVYQLPSVEDRKKIKTFQEFKQYQAQRAPVTTDSAESPEQQYARLVELHRLLESQLSQMTQMRSLGFRAPRK